MCQRAVFRLGTVPLRQDRRSAWPRGVVGALQMCKPAPRKASVGTGCGSQGWGGSGPPGSVAAGELRPKQGGCISRGTCTGRAVPCSTGLSPTASKSHSPPLGYHNAQQGQSPPAPHPPTPPRGQCCPRLMDAGWAQSYYSWL